MVDDSILNEDRVLQLSESIACSAKTGAYSPSPSSLNQVSTLVSAALDEQSEKRCQIAPPSFADAFRAVYIALATVNDTALPGRTDRRRLSSVTSIDSRASASAAYCAS